MGAAAGRVTPAAWPRCAHLVVEVPEDVGGRLGRADRAVDPVRAPHVQVNRLLARYLAARLCKAVQWRCAPHAAGESSGPTYDGEVEAVGGVGHRVHLALVPPAVFLNRTLYHKRPAPGGRVSRHRQPRVAAENELTHRQQLRRREVAQCYPGDLCSVPSTAVPPRPHSLSFAGRG